MQFHHMNYQRVEQLGYRLYSLGWRSGLHNDLSPAQHWLLSIFFYYRRGYTEGSEQIKEYRLEGNLR